MGALSAAAARVVAESTTTARTLPGHVVSAQTAGLDHSETWRRLVGLADRFDKLQHMTLIHTDDDLGLCPERQSSALLSSRRAS